jgi:hypothetical protein
MSNTFQPDEEELPPLSSLSSSVDEQVVNDAVEAFKLNPPLANFQNLLQAEDEGAVESSG